MNRKNKDIAQHFDWLIHFDHWSESDKWWTIKEKCSVICKETFKEWRWTENLNRIQHRQNHETRKVDISWFLSTFSELAVNFMCQLTIEISWFFQLLADY